MATPRVAIRSDAEKGWLVVAEDSAGNVDESAASDLYQAAIMAWHETKRVQAESPEVEGVPAAEAADVLARARPDAESQWSQMYPGP